MAKFSVRKPFTVLVGVILILVMGIVSYSKMTPDLFPNIDMPYVIVVTPYPGANPEKVESNVTKPMEQNLATLTNIKNVQSVSNANYSMIVLEFENEVNMDTVSSDILQKINLVEGNFEETVGTPTIIKMNPSMIPVDVVAVNYEGMKRTELSSFIDDTLMNKLEGTDGVASIANNGLLEEKINVVISQKKIDKINDKILANVNSELGKAQSKLNAQKSKLKSGKAEISKNKNKIKSGISALSEGMEKVQTGKADLEKMKDLMPPEQYEASMAEIEKQENQLKKQQAKMKSGLAELNKAEKKLEKGEKQLAEAQAKMDVQAAQARKQANVGDKITSEMVSGILQAQNFQMPAGYVEDGPDRILVSVGDDISSEKQIKNLFLFDTNVDSVGKVYLKDVADVFLSNNKDDLYAKINGEDGVILSFSKQSNFATAKVCENIDEKFSQLSDEYEGLTFTTLMNQGDYIKMVIKSIISSLLWGALFAVIILFIFLRGIKPTFITICSIPISIIFALLLMYFSGISINLISMSGLAVSVGMLVDNSVVVIENIVRLRRQGVPAPKAAVAGAKQVGGAITASTLTTICVFVPIVFTDGLTRQLFTDMALTMAYTLIASLIVALTLVPAMSSRLLVKTRETEGKTFKKVMTAYRGSLEFVLKHKAPVLLIALLLLVGSTYFSLSKGFIFMPEMSSPQLQATLEMDKDATMKDTVKVCDKAGKIIQDIDGVETVGIMISDDSQMLTTSQKTDASFYIMLKEDGSVNSNEVAKIINEKCADLDGTVTASGSSMGDFTSALGGEGVTIKVCSSDLDDLQKTAKDLTKTVSKVKGIEEADSGIEESDKEYHFKVNKTAAMKKGLTVAQVYSAIAEAMSYENEATNITWEADSYDVMVSSDAKKALSADKIKNLTLEIKDDSGKITKIKLNDIASLQEKETLKAINRDNQNRYLKVTGTLKEGYNVTKVTSAVKDAVEKYQLPKGTTIEFEGENEEIMDAMKDMVLMLIMGILFVYLVMVAQFQSLKSPFIIMFTIPLAFTGGFLALLLFGKEVSIISMLGMVMLVGIIVNNGIVLVDYINQLRAGGREKKEAIVEAAATRIRPILMTSLTTILGLIVMAFGNEMGTDMMQPVALVCIGGLLYATLLTLYIVPCIYDIMNRKEYKHLTEEDLDTEGLI